MQFHNDIIFYNRSVISVTKLACAVTAVWRMPSCGSSQHINTHWHAAHNNWDLHWLLFQGRVVYLVYWWNSDHLWDSLKRSAHVTGWFGLSIWGLSSVIWRAQVKEITFQFLVFFDLCTYGFDECMRVYFHVYVFRPVTFSLARLSDQNKCTKCAFFILEKSYFCLTRPHSCSIWQTVM